MHIDTTVYRERPKDKRSEREERTYDVLEKLGIAFERVDHDAAATISDCGNIDEILGIKICKNLFLCNSQKTKFYLLMMPGDKTFRTKELSHQIGSSRLSFAPESYMEEYLDLCPGSVSILGLMNDKNHSVNLLVDEDVLKEEYVGCHPCMNTTSLKIKTSDITGKFLEYTGHFMTVVKLTGNSDA